MDVEYFNTVATTPSWQSFSKDDLQYWSMRCLENSFGEHSEHTGKIKDWSRITFGD